MSGGRRGAAVGGDRRESVHRRRVGSRLGESEFCASFEGPCQYVGVGGGTEIEKGGKARIVVGLEGR